MAADSVPNSEEEEDEGDSSKWREGEWEGVGEVSGPLRETLEDSSSSGPVDLGDELKDKIANGTKPSSDHLRWLPRR